MESSWNFSGSVCFCVVSGSSSRVSCVNFKSTMQMIAPYQFVLELFACACCWWSVQSQSAWMHTRMYGLTGTLLSRVVSQDVSTYVWIRLLWNLSACACTASPPLLTHVLSWSHCCHSSSSRDISQGWPCSGSLCIVSSWRHAALGAAFKHWCVCLQKL